MRRILFSLAFLFAFPLAFFARMQEKVDLAVIQQIKNEAFRNTQVMEHAFYLSEVYGPRLTGTPNYRAAGDWAADYFRKIGLSNVGHEKFPFREGWSFDRFYVRMIAPTSATLIGVPLAWSSGTEGAVQGEAMRAEFPSGPYPEDLKKFADTYGAKLRGKILMFQPPVELKLQTTALASRASDQDLIDLSFAEIPAPQPPPPPRTRPRVRPAEEASWMKQFAEFLREQGVIAILSARQGPINDRGTVSAGPAFGGRDFPPQVVLAAEHYNRVLRLIMRNIPVRIELELDVKFYENTQDSFNVIAEIPGARKKDEVVMIGAHLDSWHGGTGATDNAAGCAIMIEAMRILKKLNLTMDRTVRVALWGGEEQSFAGSRAYVKEHFADLDQKTLKPDHKKISAYYNLDAGAGKIRGITIQENDMVKPIFEAWLAPLKDLGVSVVSPRVRGGSDFISFEAVGLPGFPFVQDVLEYHTRTHHTNMDVYDRLQTADLMQASAVVAAIVYCTATREELLPRKPLPAIFAPK